MTGFWLISFVVLWIVVVGLALVILALAREVESLHGQIEMMSRYLSSGQAVAKEAIDKLHETPILND